MRNYQSADKVNMMSVSGLARSASKADGGNRAFL